MALGGMASIGVWAEELLFIFTPKASELKVRAVSSWGLVEKHKMRAEGLE